MEDKIHYDLQLILAILGGRVSAALSSKLSRNFQAYNVDLTPDAWTVLLYLWRQDGMTQQELAEKSGVPLTGVCAFEHSQRDIKKASYYVLENLARTLGCAVEDIV